MHESRSVEPVPAPRRSAAIIGCGRMGRAHAQALAADGRAQVTALLDSNPLAAGQLQHELAPAAIVYADLPRLLSEAHPDLVIICTPTPAHFEQVTLVQQHGAHVLCEKPLADTRSRIDRLIAAARTSAAHHALGYQRRSWASFRTLRREVQSGRWGPVNFVHCHAVENWQQTIGGTWRDDPRANFGGFIGDAGSHKIDAVFYVTGLSPREVFARSRHCSSRVEIIASASGVLEGDVPLSISFVGNAQSLGEEFHVHCADADFLIRDGRPWIARTGALTPLEPLEPHGNPVSDFLNLLDGLAPNLAPFDCARPVFDFTAALLESARTGRSVSLAAL